ncbi:MAG TPA: hypothetical protein VIY90_08210 [Steroidobacteraceae bacterium]
MTADPEKPRAYVIDNLRLQELVAVVDQNKAFFDAFASFLAEEGYSDIFSFIGEADESRAKQVLTRYLAADSPVQLFDGLGRPYSAAKAKWYFLAWLLRDAPAQRLEPLLRSHRGVSLDDKKANLINHLRKFVGPLFPSADHWQWPVLAEVMLARLEGSRRALKGTRFEALVRSILNKVFKANNIQLVVGDKQVTISDETYDVQVIAKNKCILMPVKTRETMGGGHANLFTRDIFKAVGVARANGYECIPIVIAESWAGDLASLDCENIVHVMANPNQLAIIEPALESSITDLIPIWKTLEVA